MLNNRNRIEKNALLIGTLVYTAMGICGWTVYYLSHSDALLLDGNYNFVNGIASLIGYYVVKIKHKKTHTFPFGQFIYESLYSLVKGFLVLGILTASLWENTIKIIKYFSEGTKYEVNTSPIAVYTIIMVILSFGLAYYYKWKNKKIDNQSSMLITDSKTAIIDGFLSLFSGFGLLLMVYLGKTIESLEALQYIGDSLIVLLFVLVALKEPLHIIKNNFIELAGGQLQSISDRNKIEQIINANKVEGLEINGSFINKTGSMYFVLIYISGNQLNNSNTSLFKEKIRKELNKTYSNCKVGLLIN